jgi:hypothetical protein
MQYRIELRYWHGWGDACWTEEIDGEAKPMRFQNVEEAETAIGEFFAGVRAAVAAGDRDTEETRDDYRVVAVDPLWPANMPLPPSV